MGFLRKKKNTHDKAERL